MLGDPPKRVTIPKAERIGVYPDVFERVLAAKNAYYAALDARDAQSWADAEEAKAEHERRKAENEAQLERERVERDEQRRQSEAAERDARLYVNRYNEFIGYGLEPDYITAAIGEPPEGVDVADLNTSETRQDKLRKALNPWSGDIHPKRNLPRRGQVRRVSGISDVKWKEIEALWEEA